VILGTAEALDRLAGLALEVPQELCGADSIHLDLRRIGHAGSVLAVVGDGAGDGPGLELLAELGPGNVRLLAGVGRVQVACASLGLSGEIVSLVDLRRAPLAALRGQLRAHRLLAVPVADAAAPGAVARLLVDSGFSGARVWVCEFTADGLRSRAWLASELAELREHFDAHAVLIVATGPSAGVFAELPGLTDAALGDDAPVALPLAARLLALAWLQPAAWEQGWAISDGEASLALEWARAVPTARVRAVGVEPSLLGVAMARAGVGENLAAIPSASPLRCREWPMPEAVFVRGGVGLSDWLAAAWARLAPGGRLVATAEDDHARADLLAFAGEVPAEAWQELSLARGETVAGRLRFAPAAPIRLALWRKPLN
jgi:precorrin-6Y C5,15-methyltransferase (decarboxylating)